MKAKQKIISLRELVKKINGFKQKGLKIVFTNGCFDILHVGHVRLFEKAKSSGDVLVVGLNSDASVGRLKGKTRPMVPQSARAEILASLSAINYVVIFNEDTPLETIKALRPDVLVKGADYGVNEIVGRKYAGKVVRFPLLKGWSTTSLIKNAQIKPPAG